MEKIKDVIKTNHLETLLLQGNFGIERETIRTDQAGNLALTPHPKSLGSRSYHPYIQTDFSEAQPELITSPKSSVEATYRQLSAIHDILYRSLADDELLWPDSMPPILPEHDEDIPIIQVDDPAQINYRQMLAKKYGRKLQVISGIHFNFSFSDTFLRTLQTSLAPNETFIAFKNKLYMHVAENFMRYKWIITYLMGASPTADQTFFKNLTESADYYMRSIRNSKYGYINDTDNNSTVSYHSVDDYVHDVLALINKDEIEEVREYYGSVRPRTHVKFEDMPTSGIDYLELRLFDSNPYAVTGITLEQMKFIHLFLIYLLTMPAIPSAKSKQAIEKGNQMNATVAEEKAGSYTVYQEEGIKILNGMKSLFMYLDYDEEYQILVEKALEAFREPEHTLSAKLSRELKSSADFSSYMLKKAKIFKAQAFEAPYQLSGYREMEMSTQLLMFDAIQKGVEVEVVDEEEQFLLLKHGEHEEYVQKANKTSKDNYVTQLIMANKTVTKFALKRKGFHVPQGIEVQSIEEGLSKYDLLKKQKLVVKPKSTNFGLGITILNANESKEQWQSALKSAFAEDSHVILEEYVEGTEYRFLVIDGKTIAVLLRIPAQVVGDGHSTIQQLIAEKNKNSLRGTDHRKPLEKIVINQIVLDTIESQGYAIDSVPVAGEKVLLRNNSNISTGGDSVDFTQKMPDYYKEIAADIATSLGATITGVDLIIPDYTKCDEGTNAVDYTCLEANFNPAMHMHQYVAEGDGVRVTLHVLDLLFKELNILENERRG